MIGFAALLYALLFYWAGQNSTFYATQTKASTLGQTAFVTVTVVVSVLYGCFCLMERRSR